MPRTSQRLKRFAIPLIAAGLLFAVFYAGWLRPRHTVPILMYHRFGDGEGSMFVTRRHLERQMSFLRDHGYHVFSLSEYIDEMDSGRPIPPKAVVVTVDDGYRDNYVEGFPVFKKYRIPATIFLIADSIGTDPDFMTWDNVRIMSADGIEFGAHTRRHAYLPEVHEPERLHDEIRGAKEIIEANLGKIVRVFCYPAGGFTPAAKEAVRAAGYIAACTTNRGTDRFNHDRYELKRIKVSNTDGQKLWHFWVKLSGYYNLFRSERAGY
ncbi:MAG: polysaccharide deacetylase family protein [Candidatus Omnitrophica bacterium]|nr:polysaccharide deacetylase family protein [Candidatus Omnitrophota bacterium]